MSMTRICVISLCLLFHIVVFFKLLLTISNTTLNNTFKFKPLFVILLLFQLSVFRSVFVLILTYVHECWVMTERVRFRVQAVKMGFLRNVKGLFLLDKVKSTEIRHSLNIKPLLFRIEQLQLRWNGHATRMSHEQTAKQLMDAFPSGKRPIGQPRTRWRNYVEDLALSRCGIPPAKLMLVAGERDAWSSQLKLLPPQPQKDKREKRNTQN